MSFAVQESNLAWLSPGLAPMRKHVVDLLVPFPTRTGSKTPNATTYAD
jgi:hypothetical protein